MTQGEREGFGEDVRDVIEGLRRLGHEVEAPPDLLAAVIGRGEQLLPAPGGRLVRWVRGIAAWRPRLLVWGPAVAIACFIAGVFVPPPSTSTKGVVAEKRPAVSEGQSGPSARTGRLLEDIAARRSEGEVGIGRQRSLSSDREGRRGEAVGRLESPSAPRPQTHGLKPETPAPAEPFESSRARRLPSSWSAVAPTEVEVTVTLPAVLYEQLVREAQQRDTPVTSLLREALETYVQAKQGK